MGAMQGCVQMSGQISAPAGARLKLRRAVCQLAVRLFDDRPYRHLQLEPKASAHPAHEMSWERQQQQQQQQQRASVNGFFCQR
jgi:hypothetical protein